MRNGKGEIYLYDLVKKTEKRLGRGQGPQGFAAISGDTVVWKDERNDYGDIYLYNLSSEKETRITPNRSSQWAPSVAGDLIVWEDERNVDVMPNWDIYQYNIRTLKHSN